MPAGNQGTLFNTVTFGEFTDLVRRNFVTTQDSHPKNAKQLFIMDNVGMGQGISKNYTEVDKQKFASVKPEGANHSKAKVGVGYSVTMLAKTFSKEIDITLEMRHDNRYQEIGSLLMDLSNFCENRMDLDLTHRFTFANATSYTDMDGTTVDTSVGDGYAVCYAAHTLAFSSLTYSNVVTGNPGFSQSAYEVGLALTTNNLYNNFGEKITMNFNTIVTGDDPTTVRAVRQLLESTADVDATQSGLKNIYGGTKRHVILPDLATTAAGAYDATKRRWWFILASGQGVNGWQAYLGTWIAPTLVTPSTGSNGEDIHNLNWTYATYCRYGIVALSGRGIVGSFPTN